MPRNQYRVVLTAEIEFEVEADNEDDAIFEAMSEAMYHKEWGVADIELIDGEDERNDDDYE